MMDYIFLAMIAFGLGYMFLKLIQLYIGCPNPIASMLRQLWHMDELEERIKKLSSTKEEKCCFSISALSFNKRLTMFTISFPIVKCKHLTELSYYNHNVYQIESSIDCTKYTMFILEECDDDNLMEYTLAKDKDFNDIVFKWDSYWNDRIQFDKYL